MLGTQFYHETIRKMVVSFGTIFNNINIVRKDNNGTIIQKMKVPLAYGPKQKFLARLDQDADLTSKVAITLPRLGFEIQNMSYDTSRKLNRIQKFKKVKSGSTDQLESQFMPVPYNLDFELLAMAKQSDDAVQIIEQILPYFQPDYTVTINDMADMGIKRDVPIILNSILIKSFLNKSSNFFAPWLPPIINIENFTCFFFGLVFAKKIFFLIRGFIKKFLYLIFFGKFLIFRSLYVIYQDCF